MQKKATMERGSTSVNLSSNSEKQGDLIKNTPREMQGIINKNLENEQIAAGREKGSNGNDDVREPLVSVDEEGSKEVERELSKESEGSRWLRASGKDEKPGAHLEDSTKENENPRSINLGTISGQTESIPRGRPSSCVFVASLCSSKTDDELCVSVTKHFAQWGKLATVKVLRDPSDRPYAFVQYTNDQDSKNAILHGHNSYLDGRSLRCEAAKVNRTIFVTSKVTKSERAMKENLEFFGEIEQIVASDELGNLKKRGVQVKSSRSWFCKYAYRNDAIRAFANLSESPVLSVEWAQNIDADDSNTNKLYPQNRAANTSYKHKQEESAITFDKFSIFIGQLNPAVTEKDIIERFKRHGNIEEATIVKKPANTFAFVKYKEECSAASAVEGENHSMFMDRTMHVQYREVHMTNKCTPKSNGIALAPPPINLNKKTAAGPKKKGANYRKMSPFDNQQLYPIPIPIPSKLNCPPNILRPRNNYHNNKGENIPSYTTSSMGKKKASKFEGWDKLKSDLKDESPTPPESVQTYDSHTLAKSGYSASSAVNSEKSDMFATHVPKFTKYGNNKNKSVPYFYYIPTNEVMPNSNSHYYSPYHYFVPYQGSEYNQHNGFGVPFPMYCSPSNDQEYTFEDTFDASK